MRNPKRHIRTRGWETRHRLLRHLHWLWKHENRIEFVLVTRWHSWAQVLVLTACSWDWSGKESCESSLATGSAPEVMSRAIRCGRCGWPPSTEAFDISENHLHGGFDRRLRQLCPRCIYNLSRANPNPTAAPARQPPVTSLCLVQSYWVIDIPC